MCDKEVPRGELQEHMAECGKAMDVCQACGEEIKRARLELHETGKCPLRKTKCHKCGEHMTEKARLVHEPGCVKATTFECRICHADVLLPELHHHMRLCLRIGELHDVAFVDKPIADVEAAANETSKFLLDPNINRAKALKKDLLAWLSKTRRSSPIVQTALANLLCAVGDLREVTQQYHLSQEKSPSDIDQFWGASPDFAAAYGRMETLKFLLDVGFLVDETTLQVAFDHGRSELALQLLRTGAVALDDETKAFAIAARCRSGKVKEVKTEVNRLKIKLTKDLLLNCDNCRNVTAFGQACLAGNVNLVSHLIRFIGGDRNAVIGSPENDEGEFFFSPLEQAWKSGSVPTLHLLVTSFSITLKDLHEYQLDSVPLQFRGITLPILRYFVDNLKMTAQLLQPI